MAKNLLQDKVSDSLAMDAKKMLRDRVEKPATEFITQRWEQVSGDIVTYARGAWDQTKAKESPIQAEMAKAQITAFMDGQLRAFRNEAVEILNTAKCQAYELQFLIDHWIVDQVTPPNVEVPVKRNPAEYKPSGGPRRKIGMKEAWWNEPNVGTGDVDTDTGDIVASHENRTDAWVKAWGASVFTGLAMGGIQGDNANDIDARISTARADGFTMPNVLDRMVKTEVQVAIADANDNFGTDHGDLLVTEHWQTMDDERVCPICRPNKGKTKAEASHNIPAHPGCRCWYRKKVKRWKELAGDLAVPGAGDSSMVFRDPSTGEALGRSLVTFDGWRQNLSL